MRHKRAKQTATPKPPNGNGEVQWLTVVGAAENNLRGIDVHVPLGRFVCVTGVSGSGKSSLVNDIIREALARDLNGAEKVNPGAHQRIDGLEHLDKVIDIDQSPIGRTPRSNPATYIKVFDEIRGLYAKLPDSKVRGYKPGRFSFNVSSGARGGGRCEACEGNGATRVEMDFLADIWVPCPVCESRRFGRETLQILYKGKSVADVLEMDVQEALEHFANIPKIARMLGTLHDVGLDYVKLGQSSTTLSGGEAQRIKLARELVKRSTGRTLYLLDEPTTGLHFDDIKKLLTVLHGFVEAGNTVVVIEHNLEVIKTADWIIDLGPEGGDAGGRIVAEGTPEDVSRRRRSYTGQALRSILKPRTSVRADSRVATGFAGDGRPRGLKPAARRGSRPTGINGTKSITVVGAKQHNLQDITVAVPRGKTTICSGLSGSGKSSFALDTVYAEGQRRYVESLSAYARQFLGQLQKPQVDHVYGLSPAIAIEQKAASKSPRSTVGTVTEIYDYLRILIARLGRPYCPRCDAPIGTQTSDEIVEKILALGEGTRVLLLAPVERAAGETYEQLFAREKANGYSRVRVDGVVHSLDEPLEVSSRRRHAVELVVDRVVVRRRQVSRITDSVEQALAAGGGVIKVRIVGQDGDGHETPDELRFSQLLSCDRCGTSYEELTPHHFSFNARMGWCPSCEGLGTQRGASPAAIAVHPTHSLLDGALAGWSVEEIEDSEGKLAPLIEALARHIGFDPHTPWSRLTEAQQMAVLQGCGDEWIEVPEREAPVANWSGLRFRWRGFFPSIDRATRSSWQYRKRLEEMVTEVPCEACGGSRLRPEARAVRLFGKTMHDICSLPLDEALAFFTRLKPDRRQRRIAGELLHEITSRLRFLVDVGLEYVTLHRCAATLSGGESQRIRLASQLGCGLSGVLYVLDEPTIGLHPRDNRRLIAALGKLRDLGNTLLIVEHDREVIDNADRILDFGPGAGSNGGRIVAEASPKMLRRKRASLTGKYLAYKEAIPVPSNRRQVAPPQVPDRWLTVHGACQHNLKEIDAALPLGRFTAVTGVSGSGKSTLVNEILYNALASRIHRARLVPGAHEHISGLEHVDKVINVDQSPIGNSPSSNPATYTGTFDAVRDLFAQLPDSKVRGYSANRFSFNRPGGRCEACFGMGQRCIEMHFLPDVWVECESCGRTRYLRETLDVRYKGKHIADVLDMCVSEALAHFANVPKVARMLQTLDDVGLGYLRLGQPAPTLSGGEAQRVKLAAELGRPSTGKTLYILDEPTTGLHFDDLKKLLAVLHRLVDLGNTVVCIEHNTDVIKTADWVIDLGPEAGEEGGTVVVAGAPEMVVAREGSHTGAALKPALTAGPAAERAVYDPARQAELEAQLAGPVDLGDTTQMPWQRDGRQWHLVEHLDHQGKPAQWDPSILQWLIDTIERIGGFEPANWNHRSRVEVKAAGSKAPWFCHARTRGRWTLDVSIRTAPGTFREAKLQRELDVKTLDERQDLPAYGQGPRVAVRQTGRGYDDVRLFLHDQQDIRKAVFRRFLKRAAEAYFEMVRQAQADPARAEPWKADGRAWHLSQKSIPPGKPKRWRPTVLVELLGRINKSLPQGRIEWSNKTAVMIHLPGLKGRLIRIATNHAQGLKFELRVPRRIFTPAMYDRMGRSPTFETRPDFDVILSWVRTGDDLDAAQLAEALRRCRDAVKEGAVSDQLSAIGSSSDG